MKKIFYCALCALLCFSCSNDGTEDEIPNVNTEENAGTGEEEDSVSVEGDLREYVDLGLPSGTLWATCNVGANSPEEYGDYFAWGETEPKETYDWSTYKWCEGISDSFTKYCYHSGLGSVDNKTVLDSSDDAAAVNWGTDWCMPTKVQQDELQQYCTWTWTSLNGVDGRLVVGPNGNSIFLPAAGGYEDGGLDNVGSYGFYWNSSLDLREPAAAYCLGFNSIKIYEGSYLRSYGLSIRPVRASVKM